jgi:hypothetical protein
VVKQYYRVGLSATDDTRFGKKAQNFTKFGPACAQAGLFATVGTTNTLCPEYFFQK